jgi:hypothetical protein
MTTLERPIFVVGCPRSGTTLVQCILSASTQAFSLPETHFFSYVLPVLGGDPARMLGTADLATAREALESEANLALPGDVYQPGTALDLFVTIVERYRPAAGLRAIEKTPRHVLRLGAIAACFPDACFVNVVRHPVDVASSLMGVPFESSRSVLSYASRWTESVLAAREFQGRLLTVVYETLVRAPEATTRELCDFVDLPYEAAMLEEFGREAQRNIGRGETWKDDIGKGVLLNRSGVWRERMTPGQAWLVAQATRGPRSAYGYGGVSASAASIVAAAAGEFGVRFREARASTGVVGAARHAGSVLKALAPA